MKNIAKKEFVVSKTEVIRRERAFANLLTSILIGLILGLNKVILEQPCLSATGILIFILLQVFAFILVIRFFKTFSKMEILLTEGCLQRNSKQGCEKFLLKNVKKIEVKKTTRKTVREMKIFFYDGTFMFINGLDNFLQFKQDMLKKLGKEVVLKEYSEPIDFDHPLFYTILGLVIGFFSVLLTKYLMKLDTNAMNTVLIAIFLYIFAVGIYLITQKPISKRYGNKPK
ncbi:MAG: hypothetical protein PHW82_12865 [Bacteroidales bacterium]|nr:hypothetical protein [Bacteroidales bacterium]